MKTLQQQRLEVETPQERDTRLNLSQQTKSALSDISKKMCAPQIDQGYVKGKMNGFHTEMLSIESLLYSANNNMSPGFVPVELQVSLYIGKLHILLCLGYHFFSFY